MEKTRAIVVALRRDGVESSALDNLVHDAKSSEASAINNGGLVEQVEYLLSHGHSEEEIWEAALGRQSGRSLG